MMSCVQHATRDWQTLLKFPAERGRLTLEEKLMFGPHGQFGPYRVLAT